MADKKSHKEQGQIERAQRLREIIERLKERQTVDNPPSQGESLKEQVDERARSVAKRDSE